MATVSKSKKKAAKAGARKPVAPLGRYLRKFTLQNVRTFRSPVTLDFCHEDGSVAQWTVILGENGMGKTTLLQYLVGMQPTVRSSGAEEIVKTRITGTRKLADDLPYSWPRFSSLNWIPLHISNSPVPFTKPVEMSAELEIISSATLKGATLNSTQNESILFRALLRPAEHGGTICESIGRGIQLSKNTVEEFRLFGYGASRHVAGAASPYVSSDTFFQNGGNDPANTLFHDDQPLISPEQWLLGLDHAAKGEGAAAIAAMMAFQGAARCLANALPAIGKLLVKPHRTRQAQTTMTLMCQTGFGEVPFNSLSLGYRTMAAWLTDFVKRMHEAFPDLDEPDDGPAVVLIDEFDLHMHPKWQREAMAALSKEFPNTQFIVTAHSPLVVQATDGNAKLIVLRRSKREDGTEEVLVDDHPRYAAGWRVDQILSSDLYGMEPRSPKYNDLMEESIRLRQKERRTPEENARLKTIEAEMEREAPPGTSSASRQLFADLEHALKAVQGKGE